MAMLWRLLGAAQHDQPTHAAACFDTPGKTFRHGLYGAYKNNRPARDEELSAQLPYLHHVAPTMGITAVESPGFEGDDIAATLAAKATAAGWRTTVVSSDKDLAQLVVDGMVEVVDPVAHCRWDEAFVRGQKFGVEPRQVPDYQAIAGDDVDNIPGIPGIGPKSAGALVRLFGTVEEIVAATRTAPNFFTPSQRVRLKEAGVVERLQMFRTLATLRSDAPVRVELKDLDLRPVMLEHVHLMLKKLEATGRFEEIFATAPRMQRVVPPMDDPQEWWRDELEAPGQPVPDAPQCGYYETRLVRGAVLVGARIWREDEIDPITGEKTGQQILRCMVGEQPRDPVHEWQTLCRRPIKLERYEWRRGVAAWAKQYAAHEPEANPTVPIDWNRITL